MRQKQVVEENHVALRLMFAVLIVVEGWLVYAGIQVTFFNVPMRIFSLTVQHELSLALWVFGTIACFALMAIILDTVHPRQKSVWNI